MSTASSIFSFASEGIEIIDGGVTAISKPGYRGRACAVCNKGFSSGLGIWKFRIAKDVTDKEQVCIGAAMMPVTNFNYDKSDSLWMYRIYSGALYQRGFELKHKISKAHMGDIITLRLDFISKTLKIFVNDVDQEHWFTDIPADCTIYPAICFYGPDRAVNLLTISREDKPHFDDVSPNVVILNDGTHTRSTSTLHSHALLWKGYSSRRSWWEIEIVVDVRGNEMIAVGCAVKPVKSSSYNASQDLWMYRCYNGNLSAAGTKLDKVIDKASVGDIIRCDLDLTIGTLSYSINGKSQGICFTGLSGTIYPAVCFYGENRQVAIKRVCQEEDCPSGEAEFDYVSSGIVVSNSPSHRITSFVDGIHYAMLGCGWSESKYFAEFELIKDFNNSNNVCFGISLRPFDPSISYEDNTYAWFIRANDGMIFSAGKVDKEKKAPIIFPGDIIRIEVDCKKLEMHLILNSNQPMLIFQNLPPTMLFPTVVTLASNVQVGLLGAGMLSFDELSVGIERVSESFNQIRSFSNGRSHALVGTGFKIVTDAISTSKTGNAPSSPPAIASRPNSPLPRPSLVNNNNNIVIPENTLAATNPPPPITTTTAVPQANNNVSTVSTPAPSSPLGSSLVPTSPNNMSLESNADVTLPFSDSLVSIGGNYSGNAYTRYCASWEFEYTQDVSGDEMVCFGAALRPIWSSSYEVSPEMWMYRAYNGALYSQGRQLRRTIAAAHIGDVIKFELNLEGGFLAISINNKPQGVCFTGLSGCVFPAIAFYGANRIVTLKSITAAATVDLSNTFDDIHFSTWSDSIQVLNNGTTAKNTSVAKGHALANWGYSSGKHWWEFAITTDVYGDEMICVGAALSPITNSDYTTSTEMWMYRIYNGNLYERGVKSKKSLSSAHPGDVVRFTLDHYMHTLSINVNASGVDDVNDTADQVAFENIPEVPIYAAVALYGAGRSVTILGASTHAIFENCSEGILVDREARAVKSEGLNKFCTCTLNLSYDIGISTWTFQYMKDETSLTDNNSSNAQDDVTYPRQSAEMENVSGENEEKTIEVSPPSFISTSNSNNRHRPPNIITNFFVEQSISSKGSAKTYIGISEYPMDETALILYCIEDGSLSIGGEVIEGVLPFNLKVGDILKFCLDKDLHVLSLSVNSNPYVTLFDKLPDVTFTPVVAFSGGPGDTYIKVIRASRSTIPESGPEYVCSFIDVGEGVTFTNQSLQATSSTVKSTHATLGLTLPPSIRSARWGLLYSYDDIGNEMVCFGLSTTFPVTDSVYASSKQLFMYRAYNGFLYAQGQKLTTKTQKAHKGDILTFQLSCDGDSTSRSLYISINGKTQEKIFSDLPNCLLYPTVVFYGKGRSVELLNCSVPTFFEKNPLSSLKVIRSNGVKASKQTTLNPSVNLLTHGWYFGRATIVFKVVQMSPNIAIGLARKNISDMRYDKSPDLFICVLETGDVYLEGKKEKVELPKIVDGDIIELNIDFSAKTLSLTVNNKESFTLFKSLVNNVGVMLCPAVAMWGATGRVDCLSAFGTAQGSLAFTLNTQDLKLTQGCRTVTSLIANKTYALVNTVFTQGKAWWEFLISNDELANEMVCVGFAIIPVIDGAYDKSQQLWMYRGYNGWSYDRGIKQNIILPKFHKGDVVRFDMDLSLHECSISVNGISSGVIFKNLPSERFSPAVAFYGKDRSVTLKGCSYGTELAMKQRDDFIWLLKPAPTNFDLKNDKKTIKSTSYTQSMGVISLSIEKGVCKWTMSISFNDELSTTVDPKLQGSVFFGCIGLPIEDKIENFINSPSSFLYDGIAGSAYNKGKVTNTKLPKLKHGDIITFNMDVSLHTLSMEINGEVSCTIASSLNPCCFSPCVIFTDPSYSVTLLSCSITTPIWGYIASNVVIDKANTSIARCNNATKNHAILSVGYSAGKSFWEFLIYEDKFNDERICFGASVSNQPSNSAYDSCFFYMYRAYNGHLYSVGVQTGSVEKAHPARNGSAGDILFFTLDHDSHTISLKINGSNQGVIFSSLPPVTIYPAVCFYGTNLGVEVISTGLILDSNTSVTESPEDGMLSSNEGLFFSDALSSSIIISPNCKVIASSSFLMPGAVVTTPLYAVVNPPFQNVGLSSFEILICEPVYSEKVADESYNVSNKVLIENGTISLGLCTENATEYSITDNIPGTLRAGDVIRITLSAEKHEYRIEVNGELRVMFGVIPTSFFGKRLRAVVSLNSNICTVKLRSGSLPTWICSKGVKQDIFGTIYNSATLETVVPNASPNGRSNSKDAIALTQFAILSTCIESGSVSWEIRLNDKTKNDRMSFGIAKLDVNYPRETLPFDIWLYNALDGTLHSCGEKQSKKSRKCHPDDTVKLVYNADLHTLFLLINGESCGAIFTKLPSVPMTPIVVFHQIRGPECAVQLISYEGCSMKKNSNTAFFIQDRGDDSITYSNNRTIARSNKSVTSTNSAAGICIRGYTEGVIWWEFELTSDKLDDEMTCFGVTTLPCKEFSYHKPNSMFLLRVFNGYTYINGVEFIGNCVIHPGSLIRVTLDCNQRTLSFCVNGVDHGVIIRNLPNAPLHPIVTFDGANRVVRNIMNSDSGRFIATSDDISLSEGGTVATSMTSLIACAVSALSIDTKNVIFTINVLNEGLENESGASCGITCGPVSGDLTTSTNCWMVDINNGFLYDKGAKKDKNIGKIFSGDILEFSLDVENKTLGLKVNNKQHGIIFTGLPRDIFHPCVCFKSYGQSFRVNPCITTYLNMSSELSNVCSFSTECMLGGVDISPDGLIATSSNDKKSAAWLMKGISKVAPTKWRVRLVSDVYFDLRTCFGVSKLPLTSGDYVDNANVWLIRAYNGHKYVAGDHKGRAEYDSIHPGDEIEFTFNPTNRSLALSINDRDNVTLFNDLPNIALYPVFTFYGAGRAVKLLSYTGYDSTNFSAPFNQEVNFHLTPDVELIFPSTIRCISYKPCGVTLKQAFQAGVAEWVIRIDNDHSGEDGIILGISSSLELNDLGNITNNSINKDLWGIRICNGSVFGNRANFSGESLSSLKFKANDCIKFKLDLDIRKLFIYSADNTVLYCLFVNLPQQKYYPFASFTKYDSQISFIVDNNPVTKSISSIWNMSSFGVDISGDEVSYSASTTTRGLSFAYMGISINRKVATSWTFKVDSLSFSSKLPLVGVAQFPLEDFNYLTSPDIWMYEESSSNGFIYANSKRSKCKPLELRAGCTFTVSVNNGKFSILYNGNEREIVKLPASVEMYFPIASFQEFDQKLTFISMDIAPVFILNNHNKLGVMRNEIGDTVTSFRNSKFCVGLGVSFNSGVASWEMILKQDELHNEMVCFGVMSENCQNFNYETSTSMWMYRAFNGFSFGAGRKHKSVFPKLCAGESVKFILDCEAHTLSLSVGELDYLVLFDNLPQIALIPAVCFYGKNRSVVIKNIKWQSTAPETKKSKKSLISSPSSPKNAPLLANEILFDHNSPSILVNENPLSVTSSSNQKAHAVLNKGWLKGKANWEFVVVNEKLNDEKICFGLATRPVTNSEYDTSNDLWMYRSYNGGLYARGVKLEKTIEPLRKDDVLKCILDCDSHTLSMEINGISFGEVFINLPTRYLFPVICFYGDGRTAVIRNISPGGVSISDAISSLPSNQPFSSQSIFSTLNGDIWGNLSSNINKLSPSCIVSNPDLSSCATAVFTKAVMSNKASWIIEYKEDVFGSEKTCFGVVSGVFMSVPSLLDSSYISNSEMWMYEAGTGMIYSAGKVVKSNNLLKLIHQGDLITCSLDMVKKTLSMSINDVDIGEIFTNLPDLVFPAVCFYGGNRKVEIIYVSENLKPSNDAFSGRLNSISVKKGLEKDFFLSNSTMDLSSDLFAYLLKNQLDEFSLNFKMVGCYKMSDFEALILDKVALTKLGLPVAAYKKIISLTPSSPTNRSLLGGFNKVTDLGAVGGSSGETNKIFSMYKGSSTQVEVNNELNSLDFNRSNSIKRSKSFNMSEISPRGEVEVEKTKLPGSIDSPIDSSPTS